MNQNDFYMQEALGQIDPVLLEEAGAQTGKHRRSVPMRVLTVAACLAAVLAVGAVAAELAGFQVSRILSGAELFPDGLPDTWRGDGEVEDYTGYKVSSEEIFNWDKASDELRAAVAQSPDHYFHIYFNSQAELEEFLGFSLPQNAVLASAQQIRSGHQFDDEEEITHAFSCLSVFGTPDGEPGSLWLQASYSLQEHEHANPAEADACRGGVNVHLDIYGRGDGGHSRTYPYGKDWILTQETYVTAGGREATMIQTAPGDRPDAEIYVAYLSLDGLTVELRVGGDCVDAKEVLKSVLDAYSDPAA